jgi:hypothetical protein
MTLTGQVFPILEQLGIYDELVKISKPIDGVEYLDEKTEKIGSTGFDILLPL